MARSVTRNTVKSTEKITAELGSVKIVVGHDQAIQLRWQRRPTITRLPRASFKYDSICCKDREHIRVWLRRSA